MKLMSRGRRRKFKVGFNVKPQTVRFIVSLMLLSVAIVSLVSFFAPNYTLNFKIQHILKLYFGKTAIIIPFIIGSFGILFVDKVSLKFKEARVFVGLFLALFSLSSLFHILISEDSALAVAEDGGGGGMFGYKVSGIISYWVSDIGGFLLLIIVFIASLALIFNITPGNVLEFLGNNASLSKFFEKFKYLFSRKNIGEGENSIELDTESMGSFEEKKEDFSVASNGEPEQAPLFEIVQSMSEPQFDASRRTVDSLVPAPSLEISRIPSDRIWNYPPDTLLAEPPARTWDKSDVDKRIKIIKDTLESFGVDVDIDMENVKVGSSVTQYAVKPKSVTNIAKISSLQGNLALALASPTGDVRIEAPIPGKSLIGIEVPN